MWLLNDGTTSYVGGAMTMAGTLSRTTMTNSGGFGLPAFVDYSPGILKPVKALDGTPAAGFTSFPLTVVP